MLCSPKSYHILQVYCISKYLHKFAEEIVLKNDDDVTTNVYTHFIKVPRPEDSVGTFSVFASSCH